MKLSTVMLVALSVFAGVQAIDADKRWDHSELPDCKEEKPEKKEKDGGGGGGGGYRRWEEFDQNCKRDVQPVRMDKVVKKRWDHPEKKPFIEEKHEPEPEPEPEPEHKEKKKEGGGGGGGGGF